MPLTFFTLFFHVFDTYLRANFSSVIGLFSRELLQRVLILLLLAFYFFQFIDFSIFLFLYISITCLPTLILLVVIIKQDEWHIKPTRGFITKEMTADIIKLSLYSIFAGFSSAIISNIDSIMVNQMLGLTQTGVYGIVFYFGAFIMIPARSIYRITSSIIAEAFKKNDFKEIPFLYNKTCNNQLAIGALLFIGIWINIDNIMELLPAEYASGRMVILFISAGSLVEMATGINQIIIVNSNYYRYEAYFILATVVVTVIANYLLIPVYGITGSAMATAFTITVANLIRFAFLKVKYKMQPYDINSIKLICISIIAFLPGYFIPTFNNFIVDIAVRSSVVTAIYVLLLLRLEATPDINNKIRKQFKHFKIS